MCDPPESSLDRNLSNGNGSGSGSGSDMTGNDDEDRPLFLRVLDRLERRIGPCKARIQGAGAASTKPLARQAQSELLRVRHFHTSNHVIRGPVLSSKGSSYTPTTQPSP